MSRLLLAAATARAQSYHLTPDGAGGYYAEPEPAGPEAFLSTACMQLHGSRPKPSDWALYHGVGRTPDEAFQVTLEETKKQLRGFGIELDYPKDCTLYDEGMDDLAKGDTRAARQAFLAATRQAMQHARQ